jgi:hypothetical protein
VRRLALVALVPVLAACGSPSADLFSVARTGEGAGAKLALVVSDDGTVRCNRKDPVPLDAQRLLDARQLARDLSKQAALGLELEPGRAQDTTFRYVADLAEGRIAFADSSRNLPRSFLELAAFTRTVARGVCGLPR